ncbi:MAG: AfsR/SARP family transcriptional regulator, partial [Micromonosporaceae bacterium]
MTDPVIEVRLLGPLELLVDGVAVEIPRGRMRTLVAVLALSAGQPVSLGVLLDRIWGGEPPSTGRQVVQNNIWRLRRLLGSEVVATAGDGYLLRVVPEHVDALRFTRLLDAARRGADETYQMLGEALQLWRGEPLGGVSGGWERDQAAALTELYLAGVERRIDLDLAAGRHADVIVELQRQTAEQPLRETL